jgi:large subunit ribosomal protein L22
MNFMESQATAKYVRVSPRKLKLLVSSIRNLTPDRAMASLDFINKSGAKDLKKLVESALSNAKNINMDLSNIKFKEIQVLPGGAMKRFRAVSRGMAHTYKKRMSHVKVILRDDIKPGDRPVRTDKNVKVQSSNVKSSKKSK